jgi:tetratricopeptide (TPR) repeat protein
MAPQSGTTGVLFHGMAGAGKTACALELAYRYDTGRFTAFVWHKAPDVGSDIADALLRLALDMERQLPGFKMAHIVDDADALTAWLPRLTELLEQRSILIILDNLESLLWPDGHWRDARWSHLLKALLAHRGLSRTVLTSRYPLADVERSTVQVEPIHALSLNEAVLLARELPNLGTLLRGEHLIGLERGRELVARMLAVVQGHPKLIELAEGQAGAPAALGQQVERAAAAWAEREGTLAAFFTVGASQYTAEDFLTVLAGWTRGVSETLPSASRTLFHCLCALEEEDRQRWIVEATWEHLWRRLAQTGEAPDLAATLAPLLTMGLVERQPVGKAIRYTLHPGVAEVGRTEAGDTVQAAVDTEFTAFWEAAYHHGVKEEMRGGGPWIVRAGRSAAPYLLRQQQWGKASLLLDELIRRDESSETVAAVLPWLRHIASATEGSEQELQSAGLLARALRKAGRVSEAETVLRDIMHKAAAQGQFRTASAMAGEIMNLLHDTGRAEEALTLVEKMKDFMQRAGLGPWSRLFGEAMKLQLLNAQGCYEKVLNKVEALQTHMRTLPEESQHNETAVPWNVRELILDAACHAALALDKWDIALALNAEIVTITEARGAPSLEVARTRFNRYAPLLHLGHYKEVHTLLHNCRAIFEAEHAIEMLGGVFSAMADLEGALDHWAQAISFEETALRYKYLVGNPDACAMSHHNLSNYLTRTGRDRKVALAHRLAAGVIRMQIGSGELTAALQNLAEDFVEFAPDLPPFPDDFAELCRLIEAVEGVRFRDLFEHLPRRVATGDAALAAVLQGAQEIAQRMVQQSHTPAPATPRKPSKQGTRRRKSGKKRAAND